MTDSKDNVKAHLYGLADDFIKAEAMGKKAMSPFSREVFAYVMETRDIDLVNRVITGASNFNRRGLITFFTHFLPWNVEKDADGKFVRFADMQAGRKYKKKQALIAEFLADPGNDFYTWSDQNIEIKQKDFVGLISRAVKKALEGDEKSDTPPLSKAAALHAVMQHITAEDMVAIIDTVDNTDEEPEQQAAAA